MASSHNNTHGPLREITFAPVAMDVAAFDAQREVIFGARARAAAMMVTKTQDELLRGFGNDPEAFFEMVEMLSALSNECKAIQEIADAATARLMIVGNEICADA